MFNRLKARLARFFAARSMAAKDFPAARRWFGRAVDWDESDLAGRLGLAEALIACGDRSLALNVARRLPSSSPADAGLGYRLGLLFMDLGEPGQALIFLQAVVRDQPDNAKAWNNLGCATDLLGAPEEAVSCYRKALLAAPDLEQAAINLATHLHSSGKSTEASVVLESALAVNPRGNVLRRLLGDILATQGQSAEALSNYLAVIELTPADTKVMVSIGQLLLKGQNFSGAKPWFEEALSLDHENLDGILGLVACRQQLGEWRVLEELLPSLVRAYPENPVVHSDYGVFLESQNRLEEALSCYNKAIEMKPDEPVFQFHRAIALLGLGRYQQGFAAYEARLDMPHLKFFSDIPGRVWNGEALSDAPVLIVGEQGFGDMIQFIRYLPLIESRGGLPFLAVSEPLQRLFKNIPGVRGVMGPSEVRGWSGLKVPLLSLPKLFSTTESTVLSPIPYLNVSSATLLRWREYLSSSRARLRVGLVWQSGGFNPISRFKSVPFECLFPLAEHQGVQFVCLQTEIDDAAKKFMSRAEWLDISDKLTDFQETAGAICALDLVISVDTAVAHLAGALGCPVWTLLPHAPDWRWRLDEHQTPWYPTMKLLRQSNSGNWAGVMREVSRRLATRLSEANITGVSCHGIIDR